MRRCDNCKWRNPQVNGCNRCVMVKEEYTNPSAEATTGVYPNDLISRFADRPQGEWKPKNHHTDYCSNCGFEETQWRTADYNYCPNCGAKMENGGKE